MAIGLILGGMALICLGMFGWLWLCAGFRSGGCRGAAGTLALQVSAVCLVYGLLRGQPLVALFTAMFPPLAVVQVINARQFLPFLDLIARGVAPYAVVVLVFCLAYRPLRVWSVGLSLVTVLVAAPFVGDGISRQAMCEAAAKRGFDHFDRTAFASSLADAPQPLQFEVHAKAKASGQTLAWSYRAMDWYVIPPRAVANVNGGEAFTCP